MLQIRWELVGEGDESDLVVGEVEADQLGAETGEVLGNLSDEVVGEIEHPETFVHLLPPLPRPPLDGEGAVADVEAVLQSGDGLLLRVCLHH